MAKTSRVPGSRSLSQAKQAAGVTGGEDLGFDIPKDEKVPAQKKPEMKAFERNFTRGFKKIISDVFKLQVAMVLKQVGVETDYDKDPSSFRDFEHTHTFRTFDSDGKRQTRCVSVAGHYHDIGWEYDEHNQPHIVSVSGPMVQSSRMKAGKRVTVSVPANGYDDHTHDFEYLTSHEVQQRQTNVEATKVVAFEAQKGAAPAGASERG